MVSSNKGVYRMRRTPFANLIQWEVPYESHGRCHYPYIMSFSRQPWLWKGNQLPDPTIKISYWWRLKRSWKNKQILSRVIFCEAQENLLRVFTGHKGWWSKHEIFQDYQNRFILKFNGLIFSNILQDWISLYPKQIILNISIFLCLNTAWISLTTFSNSTAKRKSFYQMLQSHTTYKSKT